MLCQAKQTIKKTKDVSLRFFLEDDIPNKIEWINNPNNNYYLHYDIPLEYSKTLNWFNNKNNDTRVDCVIEFNNIPVGLIGLLNIDNYNKKAEYYICLGEENYKGKGIAKTATKLILDYAFDELNLNKVYLNVDAENLVACALYDKVGFECEGTFKMDLFHHNKFIDRKRYAILSSNYNSKGV